MLPDSLQVDVIVHLRREARHVEVELLRVTVKVLRFKVRLMGEQQVMHRPELPLAARTLRGLGRVQRVRMHVLEGKIAEGDLDATVKTLPNGRECNVAPVATVGTAGPFGVFAALSSVDVPLFGVHALTRSTTMPPYWARQRA